MVVYCSAVVAVSLPGPDGSEYSVARVSHAPLTTGNLSTQHSTVHCNLLYNVHSNLKYNVHVTLHCIVPDHFSVHSSVSTLPSRLYSSGCGQYSRLTARIWFLVCVQMLLNQWQPVAATFSQ